MRGGGGGVGWVMLLASTSNLFLPLQCSPQTTCKLKTRLVGVVWVEFDITSKSTFLSKIHCYRKLTRPTCLKYI